MQKSVRGIDAPSGRGSCVAMKVLAMPMSCRLKIHDLSTFFSIYLPTCLGKVSLKDQLLGEVGCIFSWYSETTVRRTNSIIELMHN